MIVLFALACGALLPDLDEQPEPLEKTVQVHTDLDILGKYITTPHGLSSVRFAAKPRGRSSSVPGPTDLELLAWWPLDEAGWQQLEPLLGPAGEVGTFRASPELTTAVLPPDVAAEPGSIEGTLYAATAFENIFWSGHWAVRAPGGLALHMYNR
jgi:hypothetical protein